MKGETLTLGYSLPLFPYLGLIYVLYSLLSDSEPGEVCKGLKQWIWMELLVMFPHGLLLPPVYPHNDVVNLSC